VAKYLASYIGAGLAFVLMDACWLTFMGPRLYRPVLGELLADNVRIAPAILFYVIYVIGLVVLAVRPALQSGSWIQAAVLGGLLGLVAYGAYDFTNGAILKSWSWSITVADIGWGVVASATGAVVGFWAARQFAR
jgi:uncharacterized membrane protein